MSPETRNQAIERILEAQALNARQRRSLLNDTPEPDSVLELLARAFALVDTRPADAKTHIRAAFRLAREALTHGDAEHPELHAAVALVDQPEAEQWSKRKVVEHTKDHLEDLVNGVQGKRRDEAREAVLAVIAAAGPELTGSHERPDLKNIGHQLGKAKRGVLWDLVREHQAQVTA